MKPGDCKHFTGLQKHVCAVGVSYADMRDVSEPGPAQWPCLKIPGCREAKTVCAHFDPLTPLEFMLEVEHLNRAVEAAISGKCPQCGDVCEQYESARATVWKCPTHGVVMRGCRRIGEP